MNPFLVAPSILSADFSRLGEEIQDVCKAGADWIHVDVMDGHFVPNLSLGSCVIKSIRKITSKVFDVHLMIENPEKYIDDFIQAGADRITIHIEATKNPRKILKELKRKNISCGISFKPKTPVEEIFPFLDEVDLVLVMSVEPGFGGQKFIQNMTQKIDLLDQKRKNNSFLIEVDGGINLETAKMCKKADVLVVGSYLFKQNEYQEVIQKIKEIKR